MEDAAAAASPLKGGGDSLVGLLHDLDQHQVSVSADELLREGHVRGDAGQLLQRVASHAGVRALDALEQVLGTAALRRDATKMKPPGERARARPMVPDADSPVPWSDAECSRS